MKNLVGWLQAIHKEAQTARNVTAEMRGKIDIIPEIRDLVRKDEQTDVIADRRIEELRNKLEQQLRKMEDTMNDIRNQVREIENKVDRLK